MKSRLSAILSQALITLVPMVGALTTTYNNASSASCVTDGVFGIYSGYSTDPALQCECIESFSRWAFTSDPPTRTLYRTFGLGGTTTTIVTDGSTITTFEAVLSTDTATITANVYYGPTLEWYGTALSPCCSSCTIAAATVDLFYFPTPLPESAATSFVSHGYTFISPSIYIGFSSLYAYDFCGHVGGSYATTIAFDPTEISTFGPGYLPETIFDGSQPVGTTSLQVEGPQTRLDIRDLQQNCSASSGYTFIANNPSSLGFGNYDPCHPTVAVPERVKSLDPLWAGCVDNYIAGFWDPPYQLTKAGPLLQASSPTAEPQSSATPSIVDPTSTPDPPTSTPPVGPPVPTPDPTATTPQEPGEDPTSIVVPPASNPRPADPVTSVGQPTTTPSDPGQSAPGGPSGPADPAQSQPLDPADPGNDPTSKGPSVATTAGLGGGDPQDPLFPSVFGTTTLQPGGQAITTDGVVFSIPSSGGPVIASLVSPAPSVFGATTLQPGGPAFTTDGIVFSIPSSGGTVIASGLGTGNSPAPSVFGATTLQPGGPAFTTDGTVFSIPSTGGTVIASAISPAPSVFGTWTLQPGGPAITTNGVVYSIPSTGGTVIASSVRGENSQFPSVFGSQTLVPGGSAITMAGTVYSIASSGGGVIASSPGSPSLGSIIVSFLSPGDGPSETGVSQTGSLTMAGGTSTATATGPLQVSGNPASRLSVGFGHFAIAAASSFSGLVVLL